jgi:hypothetical protein
LTTPLRLWSAAAAASAAEHSIKFYDLLLLQGIKFYDPEIVGDTPEAVEYRGLQNVVDMVAQQLGLEQAKVREVYSLCCVYGGGVWMWSAQMKFGCV